MPTPPPSVQAIDYPLARPISRRVPPATLDTRDSALGFGV